MSLISTLPDRLCEWFSDMSQFSSYTFCTQFPALSKMTPLQKPVIVFGAKSLNVLNNTTDELGTVITDSRIAEAEFTIGIHVPRNAGGSSCNLILDMLADMLLFNTTLSVSGIKSEEPEYIRNTDSLYLRATFKTNETLQRQNNYPPKLTI